jgi:hypothetical protein
VNDTGIVVVPAEDWKVYVADTRLRLEVTASNVTVTVVEVVLNDGVLVSMG